MAEPEKMALTSMDAAEGKLPGFKMGGSWRFKQSEIESWIKSNIRAGAIKRCLFIQSVEGSA